MDYFYWTEAATSLLPRLERAHLVIFSWGKTMQQSRNLLVDDNLRTLREYFRTAEEPPVVWGASAGTLVWFDQGYADTYDSKLFVRVPGTHVLPGLVAPHCNDRSEFSRSQQLGRLVQPDEAALELRNEVLKIVCGVHDLV